MKRSPLRFSSLFLAFHAALVLGVEPARTQECHAIVSARTEVSFDRRFEIRLADVRAGLPSILQAAEAAADQTVRATNLLITVPYGHQQTFAEELLNRSGGLANALPEEERPRLAGPFDIGLFAVASWSEDLAKTTNWLSHFRKGERMVLLFASRAGAPPDLPVNNWFDNGAPSGDAEEACVNTLVNVVNGWLWCLEYTAALTRRGFHPGILQGMLEEGAEAHNASVKQGGRNRLFPCRAPVPAGRLSHLYLGAIEQTLANLRSEPVQRPLSQAADRIAERLRLGRPVGLASCAHFLLAEIHRPRRSPWTPVNVVWQTRHGVLNRAFKPGDAIIWFGYVGISTPLEDYHAAIRNAGLELVAATYTADLKQPANNAGPETIVIPQSWTLPDAAVPIPFPPGHMGPVSGIECALIYRLLDDAVAERLAAP